MRGVRLPCNVIIGFYYRQFAFHALQSVRCRSTPFDAVYPERPDDFAAHAALLREEIDDAHGASLRQQEKFACLTAVFMGDSYRYLSAWRTG